MIRTCINHNPRFQAQGRSPPAHPARGVIIAHLICFSLRLPLPRRGLWTGVWGFASHPRPFTLNTGSRSCDGRLLVSILVVASVSVSISSG
jgi:hypothetical protein